MKQNKAALPSPDHAAAGDLLRVLSVFLVAWFHIWQQSWLWPTFTLWGRRVSLSQPVRAGYIFVDLMLALSGFLLYLPYANRKERSVREFFTRRALRILPSYWLCLLVMLAFAVAEGALSDPGLLAKDLLAHLSFTHNFFVFSYVSTRFNVVLWTLAVEVQFYLLLPLLAPWFRKRPLPVYALLCGAALLTRALVAKNVPDTTLWVNQLPCMLDVYANGMLAAHVYARLAGCEKRRRLVALAATLLCLAALWGVFRLAWDQGAVTEREMIRRGQMDRRWLFSFCGAVFLCAGSLSVRPLRALFSNPPVRFLAALSYNYYIWHQWLAVKLKQWRIPPYLAESDPNAAGEQPWQLRYTLACFLGALLLAAALTWGVEKPCAALGRRLLARRREKTALFTKE